MENTDLFQEDASLPAQYWDTFARKRELEPEKRLLLAVLDNAVRSYRTLVFTGGRRFVEVENWIFSDEMDDTFSYRNICDVLGMSATRIRQSLRTWTNSAPRRPAEKQRRLRGRPPYERPQVADAILLRRGA
ncbi:MAG TPA: hypothetical protein VHL99_01685 [Candidatus Binatia bacterium]|jgi:hypothetical protein|nr:hypothetical protein [Candidatus Binatia bacterium]